MQAAQCGVAGGGIEVAFLHQAFESRLDVLHPPRQRRVIHLPDGDVVAAGDGGLRDAGAHQAGSGDVELLDGHAESLSSSRAITKRWISFVPSYIWVIFASRIIRSAGKSRR